MNYDNLFDYVKNALTAYDWHGGVPKNQIRYSRYDHTVRVYNWAMMLAEDYADVIDMEALKIATIFHDIGYSSDNEDKYLCSFLETLNLIDSKVSSS